MIANFVFLTQIIATYETTAIIKYCEINVTTN